MLVFWKGAASNHLSEGIKTAADPTAVAPAAPAQTPVVDVGTPAPAATGLPKDPMVATPGTPNGPIPNGFA